MFGGVKSDCAGPATDQISKERQARASVLDEDGNFGRIFRFESPGDMGRVRGIGPFTDQAVFCQDSLKLLYECQAIHVFTLANAQLHVT